MILSRIFTIRIFNAMVLRSQCGNGARCFARCKDEGLTNRNKNHRQYQSRQNVLYLEKERMEGGGDNSEYGGTLSFDSVHIH